MTPQKFTEPDSRIVAIRQPASWEADRYRMLRRALDRARGPERARVVAITSAAAREGKSVTALNLAAVLAEIPGRRVLLIDADLRCSSLARLLGVTAPRPDLGDAVEDGTIALEDVVTGVLSRHPFSAALVRARPDRAHEILESPRFGALLVEARRTYDAVVIDAPPAALVGDCRAIARWVDGFLVVAAAHRTSRRGLAEAMQHLEPQEILGMVFNASDEAAWVGAQRYYVRSAARLAALVPVASPSAARAPDRRAAVSRGRGDQAGADRRLVPPDRTRALAVVGVVLLGACFVLAAAAMRQSRQRGSSIADSLPFVAAPAREQPPAVVVPAPPPETAAAPASVSPIRPHPQPAPQAVRAPPARVAIAPAAGSLHAAAERATTAPPAPRPTASAPASPESPRPAASADDSPYGGSDVTWPFR